MRSEPIRGTISAEVGRGCKKIDPLGVFDAKGAVVVSIPTFARHKCTGVDAMVDVVFAGDDVIDGVRRPEGVVVDGVLGVAYVFDIFTVHGTAYVVRNIDFEPATNYDKCPACGSHSVTKSKA